MTDPREAALRATALETIVAVSEAAHLAADEDDLARAVNDALLGQGKVDGAAIYRLSADGRTLDLLDDEGLAPGEQSVQQLPVAGSLNGVCVGTGQLVHVLDVRADSRVNEAARGLLAKAGIGSVAVVPIRYRKDVLGTLSLLWKDVRELAPVEREAYGTVGRTVGLAMHNLRRMHELQQALSRADSDRAQIRLILETVPLRLFWKDRDCRYTGCNALFARDTGHASVSDVIGKTDADMPWKDQAATLQRIDREVMQTGLAKIKYELDLARVDGTVHRERVSKMPVRDAHGEVVGVLGCYEDVTERLSAGF